MKRNQLLQLLCGLAVLAITNADPLAGMDKAIAAVPQRAVRVVQISQQANTIANSVFDVAVAADFKIKYTQSVQTEKDIGAEINDMAGLNGQISNLHQQTTVRKGEEETNINRLNAEFNRITADVDANSQYLARVNAELATAEVQLAEAERKLAEAEQKKRRRRRKWRWFPPANWVIRAIDHFKKEVPKRRRLRDSVMETRNRVAAARDQGKQQRQQLQNQLAAARQNLDANNALLNRINVLLNSGNVSKQQLVEMHLYLGRLHPHMEVINQNLELVDKLAEKTPAEYARILKDSLTALQQFNTGQQAELDKFQQIAGYFIYIYAQ